MGLFFLGILCCVVAGDAAAATGGAGQRHVGPRFVGFSPSAEAEVKRRVLRGEDDARTLDPTRRLPGAVVEVRVPRGPGAVEGKGQLLVVLVLLTPHPEGGEHFDLNTGNHVSLWTTRTVQTQESEPPPSRTPTAGRSRSGGGREAGGSGQRHVKRGRFVRRNALRRPQRSTTELLAAYARVPDANEDAAHS